MVDWTDRIDSDPEIIGGKPKIKGTRIAVELLLEWLAAGETEESILRNYPHLTHEDVLACLGFASELARDVRFYQGSSLMMRLLADENFPRDLVDVLGRPT